MGRHQRQPDTPSNVDHDTQAMPLIHASNTAGRFAGVARGRLAEAVRRLRETVRARLGDDPARRRQKLVLGGAVAVVSLLAVGGMVTVVRSLAAAEADTCGSSCATARTPDRETAGPRTSAPGETAAEPKTGRTLAPAVVREKKSKPRATRPAPSSPPRMPGPGWWRHGPYGHHHGPGGW